jgi:hypothetical protein
VFQLSVRTVAYLASRFTALFLLIARCTLFFQHRRTRGLTWGQWQFPAGQLTVEFTVKLLRQETREGTTAALDHQDTTGA